MIKKYCEECDCERDYYTKMQEITSTASDGIKFTYQAEVPYCSICHEEVIVPDIFDKNIKTGHESCIRAKSIKTGKHLKPMKHTIKLRRTSFACPEQYEVYDSEGNEIAYLRLRHGHFKAECPHGGKVVYSASTIGDGLFDESERELHLDNAIKAIMYHYISEKQNKC